MTVSPGGLDKPCLTPVEPLVEVQISDVIFRRRAAFVAPRALQRRLLDPKTRLCPHGCGAVAHHGTTHSLMDPLLDVTKAVSGGQLAVDNHNDAILTDIRGVGIDPRCLHLDKPWSTVPADAQHFLLLPANAHFKLLMARKRLRANSKLEAPRDDRDPATTCSVNSLCLRIRGRKTRVRFVFHCNLCGVAGHRSSCCPVSVERAAVVGLDNTAAVRDPF